MEFTPESKLRMRRYQLPVFEDNHTGVLVLHWSRQIGKSFTLAAWAVDRLMTRPGRLVTVLSSSRENGVEFLQKCREVCVLLERVLEGLGAKVETKDLSPDMSFENMQMEVRITATPDDKIPRTGRIKALAANPRTARGFSGDLILDEFAFHEDSAAIWEAAEPILSSNPDFLCRIASTGNGKHNLFYRISNGEFRMTNGDQSVLAAATTKENGAQGVTRPTAPWEFLSQSGFLVSRVPRTLAHQMGVAIYDARTRAAISPEAARAQALDKRAYDQNYECAFADESATLLTHELISAAEADGVGMICEHSWQGEALTQFKNATGNLYVGFDVARRGDLSVITVIEILGGVNFVRGILRMRDLRLPEQQARLGEICRMPKFHRAAIDMTGLGLGLFEYAQDAFGASRIHGINFSSSVPATDAILGEGRKRETVRVTEALALELLQAYEARRMRQPADAQLRDDLRKPEKITTPGGRVSIAATRDEAGHADHFWSLALALEAASVGGSGKFAWEPVKVLSGARGRLV